MRSISLSLIVTLTALAVPAPARAQAASRPAAQDEQRCAPSPVVRVVVQMTDRTERRGTLVCLTRDELVIAAPGGGWTVPMTDVRRIIKPADPVWDGTLKGLAFGTLIAMACGAAGCSAGDMMSAVVSYAALGTLFDAVDPHREVLYGNARPRLSFVARARF